MKTGAGGDIEIEIGVVHPVQPPKRRHRMDHNMLQIDGEVEQNHGHDNGKQ